jgi:excisionase family DNA binding protein
MDVLTFGEAARELGITTSTLRAQVARGRLAAWKSGHFWLVRRGELDRYRSASPRGNRLGTSVPSVGRTNSTAEASQRDLAIAVAAGRGLQMLVAGWLRDLGPDSTRADWPETWVQQVEVLLQSSAEAFSVCVRCAELGALAGVAGQYRYLTEALVLARWLAAPDEAREREQRSERLNADSLVRLRKMLMRALSDGALAAQQETLSFAQDAVRRRLARGRSPRRIPRQELFDLLPGGYPVFHGLSELFAHPGPAAAMAHSGSQRLADTVFFLSASFATFGSMSGEIASALGRDEWVEGVLSHLDNAPAAVRVAWGDLRL